MLPALAPLEEQRTLYSVLADSVKLFLDTFAVAGDVAVELIDSSLALNDTRAGEVPSVRDEAVVALVEFPVLEHYSESLKL